MIRKSLISLIYEAASIQRWNDHIRPHVGFTELDKQSHKMFYSYILSRCDNDSCNRLLLLEGGIFEFLHRVILTDIKPPVYHSLMKEKGAQINKWVLNELQGKLKDLKGNFYEKMTEYFLNPEYAKREKEILRAGHYYATDWEFKTIYPQNQTTYGIEQVKFETAKGLSDCNTFEGFKVFSESYELQKLLSLIGKLRYQQRWSRAVRLPQTSVMGHILVVAILSYFCSLEIGACEKRLENNFFAALFHDLPEVLTRDIVSPVKASVSGLDELIAEIEDEQMKKIIYPLIPESWQEELEYFTKNEFMSRITDRDSYIYLSSDDITQKYNKDCYHPIDGEIIRGCDHLSAYIEAYMSLKYGIQSEQMQSGYHNLSAKYENKVIAGIDFGQLFDYFRI